MLHYIDGNLLDNNLGFEVDCKTNKGDKRKLGSYSRTYNTNPIVINAYTQYHYNGRLRGERDADYDAIILRHTPHCVISLIKHHILNSRNLVDMN